ncbi:MAG TPA: YfhO family protein [Candidatus Omnitrophota bacterium]|nr:YfhO family protein [Candidatus Omnitrophota bacterium]
MKKKDLLIFLFFALATLAFFFRFLDGREMFAFKDLSRYFYPLRHLMAEQVAAGQLPLWNPYIYFGTPLLAGLQVGFFYPLTVIHYLLPFDLAFNYYIIVHYFLAALFTYLLARHLGTSRSGSVLSAAAFAFSGYLLSVSNMNTTLTSVTWLPLAVMFWDRALKKGGLDLAYLVLTLTLMFLGGEPTIIYTTGFMLFFWGVVFAEGRAEKLRSVAVLIGAFAATACIAGIQLVPFLELSKLSNRVTMTQYDLVSMRSLPFREVLGFVFPYFFGNQIQAGDYSPVLLGKIVQDWLLSPYLGIIPFVFLWFAFSGKKKRLAVFLAAAGLIGLVMAFGHYTPVHHIAYFILPGISMIRYPIKFVFLTTFAAALLAGIGFDRVREDDGPAKKCLIAFVSLFVIFGAGYLAADHFRNDIFFFLKHRYASLPPYFVAVLWHNLLFNLKSAMLTAVIAFCISAALLLKTRGKLGSAAFGVMVIGVLCFDLFSNNVSLNFPSSAEVYHAVPANVKAIMAGGGVSRVYYSPELEKHNRSVYGPDFDAALIESLDKLTSDRLMPYHIYDSFGYESIELQEYVDYFREFIYKGPFGRIRLVDLADAGYLADLKPITAPGIKLMDREEYFYGKVFLYNNPNHIARPFIAGKYLVAASREAVFAAMSDPKFDPEQVVVLPEDPKVVTVPGTGRTRLVSYRPNEVSAEAELTGSGFLVLSDSYYPGWKVLVDGREEKIFRADYMFRAVYLGPGRHTVRFIYDPWSLKLGALLSLFGLLGLAAYSVYCMRRQR